MAKTKTSPRKSIPAPYLQFEKWFKAASKKLYSPETATLATCSLKAIPSARVVLYKSHLCTGPYEGFQFFTNYQSKKSKELIENPNAALVFYWEAFGRQIRIEGTVKKLPTELSDAYWATRPRDSQLGAHASHQSRAIPNRLALENRLREVKKKYHGTPVPRPAHWGGFCLKPNRIEFWTAHPFRLHHRLSYTRSARGWKSTILSP